MASAAERRSFKAYEKAMAEYDQRIRTAEQHLRIVESPGGYQLARFYGVVLYERWIATPQGAGWLHGAHASAADDSNVTQRLTATRIATLGVFSLAAPKRKGIGFAYVIIEGPHVSGVVTIPANGSAPAGPKAFNLAARINNAARSAEQIEPHRPALIEQGRLHLAAVVNDRRAIDAASYNYHASLAGNESQ